MFPQSGDGLRRRRADDPDRPLPLLAVWELTLKCDQPCRHCGSRAGRARSRELTTAEALEVGTKLARLGCRELVFIGGEAYLRTDLAEIVAAIAKLGIRVQLQTGGRAFHERRAKELAAAGLFSVGVSVDGLAPTHDLMRGNAGSHAAALRALDAAAAAGMPTTVNTHINRLTLNEIRGIVDEIRAHGASVWQPGLTVPMGRAADHPEWLLEPWQIVEVIDTLAAIQLEAATHYRSGSPFDVYVDNTIGYYGPFEHVLRSRPGGTETHFSGCAAGEVVIGIESDGTVKGCPSLTTDDYAGGNLLETPLEELWAGRNNIHFVRERSLDELWGHCKSCYYAETCRGGCSWMAHSLFGRRGNNPYCYHRAKELERRGVRERLVQIERAPQRPFDHGLFAIEEEPIEAGVADAQSRRRRRLPVLSFD
jgi:radical SAM protein with 4Fe4S-binding SPASM domain